MTQPTIQQMFDLALRHHQAGRLHEARQLYQQILARQPRHAEAMHYLGVVALQAGRNDIAVDLIRRAIALKPNDAEALSNLGIALANIGRLDEAIGVHRQAVALKSDRAESHNSLGVALADHGQLDEATAAYRQAIALKPNYTEAHSNLGNALRDKGQFDEAVAAHRQAIAANPELPAVHYNLGNALRRNGQLDEAIIAYRQAIALKPNYIEAHNNLGNTLASKGRLDEAIASYRQAIALNPHSAEAHSNVGNALAEKGQLDEAIASYRHALALNPNSSQAYGNLAKVLKDRGQLDEAVAAYRHAIALNTHYTEAHSSLIYSLYFHPGYDARMIYEELGRWNQLHAESLKQRIQPHANDRDPGRRLKIGYVAPDFRDHCQSFFTVPLLSHHDRQNFEIVCYADVPRPDAVTARLQGYADIWRRTVGLTDEQLAAQIRNDQIDILVDLTMHMVPNRLLAFARKPAPVQVCWLAYPGSTGMGTIDYRLSDPSLDPPGMDESVYSEQTIRLPNSFWCYDPMENIPVNSLPALEAGVVTFGCLNNFCKVNNGVLDLWAAVLRQVAASRLVLLTPQGSHRQPMVDRLRHGGIDPQRVELIAHQPRQEYLRIYHRIDLGMDSFPYNGHTTSLDSFWMGVPVVTLTGRTAVGRGGVSILTNLGLPELIARTPRQYIQIATALAGDLPRLAELRAGLRQRMESSPLMDATRFARNVEAAYRQMWRKWLEDPR